MNWDALGSIGEITGAIGVIVTLIYLAKQIRESNLAARQSAMQELMNLQSQLLGQISRDNSMSELWIKGTSDDPSLSEADKLQFRVFLMQLSVLWQRCYYFHLTGKIDHWFWDEVKNGIASVSASPGFRSWFEDVKHRLSDDWQNYISIVIESTEESAVYRPQGIQKLDNVNEA